MNKWIVISAAAAWLFWLLVNLTSGFTFTIFYYLIIIFICGGLLYRFHSQISFFLKHIPLPRFFKICILGILTILFEEMIAGIMHNLTEGFSIAGMFLRVQQFQTFNLFTFAGYILFWSIVLGRIRFSYKELFIISGIWGLWAEQMYTILGNPLAFLSIGTLTFFVYGVIIMPMAFCVDITQGKSISSWLKYPAVFLGMFILSIIPVGILVSLMKSHPEWFPPAKWIQ